MADKNLECNKHTDWVQKGYYKGVVYLQYVLVMHTVYVFHLHYLLHYPLGVRNW